VALGVGSTILLANAARQEQVHHKGQENRHQQRAKVQRIKQTMVTESSTRITAVRVTPHGIRVFIVAHGRLSLKRSKSLVVVSNHTTVTKIRVPDPNNGVVRARHASIGGILQNDTRHDQLATVAKTDDPARSPPKICNPIDCRVAYPSAVCVR
jgi:hypothetical protein